MAALGLFISSNSALVSSYTLEIILSYNSFFLLELNISFSWKLLGVSNMSYQKEEVVEIDENLHRIGLQVIGGGRLGVGFTFYKNTFQLTSVGDSETLVDLTVNYVTECQETEVPPGELVNSGVHFIQTLEAFLLKQEPIFSENE